MNRIPASKARFLSLGVLAAALAVLPGCILVVGGSSRSSEGATWYTSTTWPRKRIGVLMGEVSPALAAQLGIEACRASVIDKVLTGSPAEKAGLKQYDVIAGIDNQPNGSADFLHAVVRGHKPGETVCMKILRNGQPMEITVTVEERADWND